jgi:UDP:flavonoid glycosyltransferase YjiC (YdhE family)
VLNEGRHDVAWLALTKEQAGHVARAGVKVIENSAFYPLRSGDVVDWFKTDESRVAAFRAICIDVVQPLLASVRASIRRYRPDAVVVDSCTWLGVIAAELERVPWIGMCMGLKLLDPGTLDYNYARLVKRLDPVRDGLFGSFGIRRAFRLMECVSPSANIVFATRALVGDAALPPKTHLVGPSIPRGRRGDEPSTFDHRRLTSGRRLVYVALGSALWRVHGPLMARVAGIAGAFDADVVVSVGDGAQAAGPWPANVIATPYAPQLELLARADVFVTHGGANSVMEAMNFGVPLLVMPIWADQPLQAHFVERAGAGLSLDPANFSDESCRDALVRLLARDGRERAAARRVRDDYARCDGGRSAAERILEVARAVGTREVADA